MVMIFGLGSGRCGTASLARLLNVQPRTVCFHEVNPACMAWTGSDSTLLSLLNDFQEILRGGRRAISIDLTSPGRDKPLKRLLELDAVDAVGDVASYYLPYVEKILSQVPEARFPCLYRDRQETVDSFVKKLAPTASLDSASRARSKARNHWAAEPGFDHAGDPKWDKCFPTYPYLAGQNLRAHVEEYHRCYYEEAYRLAEMHPRNVQIFEIDLLNDPQGRLDILEFVFPGRPHVDRTIHENAGGKASSLL